MLPKSFKIFPVAPRLSYEPSTSDETQIGLHTDLKRALNQDCATAGAIAAQRSHNLKSARLGADDISSARSGSGLDASGSV